MSNDSRAWVVPVVREGAVYAVNVLAATEYEARTVAEGVVDADGVDQWPCITGVRAAHRTPSPCSECGHPDPGHWCDGCGWQK